MTARPPSSTPEGATTLTLTGLKLAVLAIAACIGAAVGHPGWWLIAAILLVILGVAAGLAYMAAAEKEAKARG